MKYSKIQGLYKRYTEGDKKGKFIIGDYSEPEFELLKDITWLWEEKLDGTNLRVEITRHRLCPDVTIKGKTEKSQIPEHLLDKMKEMINKDKIFELFPQSEELPDVTIFGEGIGYKIQNGCKYFGGKKVVGFVVFDINIAGTWMTRETKEEMCEKLDLPIVPIIGQGNINTAIMQVKNGFTSTYGAFEAEGLVIRPFFELRNRRGRRIITKIKTIDFKEEK